MKNTLILVSLILLVITGYSQVTLLKDINQQLDFRNSNPETVVELNGHYFFVAFHPDYGKELWKTDGTAEGTVVFDLYPGVVGSNPTELTVLNGKVYFQASFDFYGTELGVSDGTLEGTKMLKNINEGIFVGSSPQYLTVHNSTLFFSAWGSEGRELWKSDGTESGTVLVKDIHLTGNSEPSYLISHQGFLYFSAKSNSTDFYQLWKSDGTAAGTQLIKDFNDGTPSYIGVEYFTPFGNDLFFKVIKSSGNEFWKTDGTEENTIKISDLNLTGPGIVFNNLLYFPVLGFTGTDRQLWRTDGTIEGTELFQSFPSFSELPDEFITFENHLYYAANSVSNGRELWKTDGTIGGTNILKDINTGASGSNPHGFFVFNSKLFFTATTADLGVELWSSNGTQAGTELFLDLRPGAMGSDAKVLWAGSERFLFIANNGVFGKELWLSNGTFSGTKIVKNIYEEEPADSNPTSALVINNVLFFSADDGLSGKELWKTDGTAEGTVRVKDINPGTSGSNPDNFFSFNSMLYFSANDGVNGIELWKSDGTESGTVLVKDINSGTASSSPNSLTKVGNIFYFVATTSESGSELWKSDGTTSGTQLVQDIDPGSSSSFPEYLTAFNDKLLFSAYGGMISGRELYISDGTSMGTFILKDINPGVNQSIPKGFIVLNNMAIFSADDGSHGEELWKTDGTTEGTSMLKDISSGSLSSFPSQFILHKGEIYFRAIIQGEGVRIWKTDGTNSGTVPVTDNLKNLAEQDLFPVLLTSYGNDLIFSANLSTGNIGHGLWKTDCTAQGTVNISEAALIQKIVVINNALYFLADKGYLDIELWKSNGSICGTMPVTDTQVDLNAEIPFLEFVNSKFVFPGSVLETGRELYVYDISNDPELKEDIPTPEITLTKDGDNIILTSSAESGNRWYRFGFYNAAIEKTYQVTQFGEYTVRVFEDENCYSFPSNSIYIRFSQEITFSDIEDQVIGAANVILNASSNRGLSVNFVVVSGPANLINGNELVLSDVGTVVVKAFNSGNEEFEGAEVTKSFEILATAKAEQQITFDEIVNKNYGDSPFNLIASSSSGLEISFELVDGPASISSGKLTISGIGDITVRAKQDGDDDYSPAAPVDRKFTVNKANLSVKADSYTITYGDDVPEFTYTISGFVYQENSSVLKALPSATSSVNAKPNVGGYVISVSGAEADNYNFNYENGILTVSKANQTITLSVIEDKLITDPPFDIEASVDTGLDLIYEISGPALISGKTVTLSGVEGNVVIKISQEGNDNYNPVSKEISFNVIKPVLKPQEIIFDNISDQVLSTGSIKLSAIASSGIAVSYEVLEGPARLSLPSTLEFLSAGKVTVRAYNNGTAEYLPAEAVNSFCINPNRPGIDFDINANTLSSSESEGNNWFFNGQKIEGERGKTLQVKSAGIYSVQVTMNGCISEMSSDFNVVITDLEKVATSFVSVYPNPASNTLYISFKNPGIKYVKVFSSQGVLLNNVQTHSMLEELSVAEFSYGVYFIEVQQGSYFHRLKLLKN